MQTEQSFIQVNHIHFYLASETKTGPYLELQTFVLLLVNKFGKQTLYTDIDENRCIYISLCNIDHDSSDQIVYYMIVEQEPFTIGICRFLIKKKVPSPANAKLYFDKKTYIELTCLFVFGGHRYPV